MSVKIGLIGSHLGRSNWSPIQRMERKHHVLLALIIAEFHANPFVTNYTGDVEIRRCISHFQHEVISCVLDRRNSNSRPRIAASCYGCVTVLTIHSCLTYDALSASFT